MLIRFNCENFLSFNTKIEFSLIANKERRLSTHLVKSESLNILKAGVIYGANASGKSNFVKAIDFSQKVVTKGLTSLSPINSHFRLKSQNISAPTVFNYEIKIDNKFYSYGFALQLNEGKVLEEWLFEISKNKEQRIFERFINSTGRHEIKIGLSLDKKAKNKFDVYKEDFQHSDSLLFLSEINRKSMDEFPQLIIFKKIYNWFDNQLNVIFPESKFSGIHFLGDDNEMTKTFNSFLKVFQVGISNLTSKEIDLDNFVDIPKEIKTDLIKDLEKNSIIIFEVNGMTYSLWRNDDKQYKIKKIGLAHIDDKGEEIVFDFEDASDGTQRLFDFIPALHELTKTNAIFVIDELDRSLHSMLTRNIIEMFLKMTSNNESQLIATTHESLILDLDLLRRDEIWFVEKENNESKLYSLDQFKIRNDKVIMKDYLLGRYGAIPIFKSFQNLNP